MIAGSKVGGNDISNTILNKKKQLHQIVFVLCPVTLFP